MLKTIETQSDVKLRKPTQLSKPRQVEKIVKSWLETGKFSNVSHKKLLTYLKFYFILDLWTLQFLAKNFTFLKLLC